MISKLPICVFLAAGAAGSLACSTPDRGEGSFGIDADSAGPGASSNAPEDGAGTADGSTIGSESVEPTTTASSNGMTSAEPTTTSPNDSGTDDHTKFDFAVHETTSASSGENTGGKGCKKIDFLFVIDNSSSMGAHQQNLVDSIGPFMDTITSMVQGSDYHIMALDSDACPRESIFEPCLPGCEGVLGAGQVRDCPVPDGRRYLTSAVDAATLKSTFQCMANVGTTGFSWEMPMTAIVEAIGPLNASGQCNEGFLRNDAILVITVISDDHSGWSGNDNENGYGGTPQSWFDAVVAAKLGRVENIVVLGLYAILEDQSCIYNGVEEADQFITFTETFGSQGIIGSVCEPDYNNPFFQQAVGLIDTTCEQFEPPE